MHLPTNPPHWCSLIVAISSRSLRFLWLIKGLLMLGECGGCCSYGNEQIQIKQTRWIGETDWDARCARAEKYVLRQWMSGQVDWELQIGCQKGFMQSSLESPCLPPGTPLYLFHSFTLLLCRFFLDGIHVNRWWPVSPPLLPYSISQGNKIK